MTRVRILSLAFLSLAFVLGCSGGSKLPARVSGTLKYKGQPIKAAVLLFHSADGEMYGATVNQDGTYIVPGAAIGELVITVETESFNKNKKQGGKYADRYSKQMSQDTRTPPPGAGGDPSENYTKIPEKYADKEKSPLKFTTVKGDNKFDIDLTD